MFQRLKGAIDSRIAEEQARQRQAAQPSTARPRRLQNGGTPTRRTSKQRSEAQDSTEKGPGPDPAEFEPDFAVGEDESAVPSRVGTPLPEVRERGGAMKGREADNGEKNGEGSGEKTAEVLSQEKEGEGAGEGENGQIENLNGTAVPATALAPTPAPVTVTAPSPKTADLPTEVRVKLRKLERLEGRYQELLKAYKTAHARIQQIDPFEATLRENTPLTSIRDPGAFVEYLNQTALKGDMVLDELKRVSGDRDEYKKKFAEAEKNVVGLRGEVVELKAMIDAGAGSESHEGDGRPSLEAKADETIPRDVAETPTAKSPTPSTKSRLPSLTLFSPKSKAKSPPIVETSEEFFSYDSEVPRLEAELEERQAEVESLQKQVDSVKGDLAVARESTESMVQTLETATRELHGLRDAKDKFESTNSEMQAKIDELQLKVEESSGVCANLQKQIDELTAEKDRALQDLKTAEEKTAAATKSQEEAKESVAKSQRTAEMLNEKLSQKDATVKDLEDTLAMCKSAERQEAKKAQEEDSSSEKRIATMQNIMDSLKTQLKSAETTVVDLNKEIAAKQEEFAKKPSTKVFGFLDDQADSTISGLDNRDAVVRYLADKFDLRKTAKVDTTPAAEPLMTAAVVPPAEAGGAGKKKNRKKRKGKSAPGGGTDTTDHDVPMKVTEDLADADDELPSTSSTSAVETGELQKEIAELREQIESRNATIDRLSARMKDQEAMREEIETLRDDLLHQGEEHVEARDALKQALIQKKALEESVERLEKELGDAQKKLAGGVDIENAHGELVAQFEELKVKSTTLQTDLAAAEQLATARFKDITDLREVLSKAQPELRSLRNEVAELKVVKDDLKNKTGEMNRLEARHDDLKSEMKGLGKRLSDKDAEVKELNQKIEQETSGRSKAEDDLRVAQSDLRVSEARKQESIEVAAQTSKDLVKAKEEILALKGKLRDLEDQLGVHAKQVTDLRDELSLKAALHATSQSLVQSLRDQTHELSTQARESGTRAESLEEELTEVQRMLSERTRESQTMRMLLSQAETGTEARLREMKERMEAAVEERDRVEDEAGVASRRMVREVEEARGRVRDASHRVKVLEEEKEEADMKLREMRRRVGEVEAVSERSTKEVREVRGAMEKLREALDESERVVEELEGQKAGMKRELDEVKERAEKLARANKVLGEEMKGIGVGMAMGGRKPIVRPGGGGVESGSGVQSERSSFDSAAAAAGRVRSPTPRERILTPAASVRSETPTTTAAAPGAGPVDYVYLKNVLLQFLEQRDKNHQKQLVPVLGMLLHFDPKDEQKWMAAISAR